MKSQRESRLYGGQIIRKGEDNRRKIMRGHRILLCSDDDILHIYDTVNTLNAFLCVKICARQTPPAPPYSPLHYSDSDTSFNYKKKNRMRWLIRDLAADLRAA